MEFRKITSADEATYPECQKVVLLAPPGFSDTVGSLETLMCDGATTSFWKPNREELHLLLEGGSVELTVMGAGMPPVALSVSPNG